MEDGSGTAATLTDTGTSSFFISLEFFYDLNQSKY